MANKKSSHPGIRALEQPEKTCRRWRLTVSAGRDYVNGGYIRHERNFRGTLTEAKEEYRRFKNEVADGINVDMASLTFGEFAAQWVEERKQSGDVAKGTIRKNEYHISLMAPYVASVKLSDFSRDTVKRLMLKLRSEGGEGGRPLSGTTTRNVFSTLRTMLGDANMRKAIKENPCSFVPAPKEDTEEKDPLPVDEARRLGSILMEGEASRNKTAFLLALSCGLRREEICGLRWCDFDSKARCIRVRHALPSDGKTLEEPKSEKSKRIIPLDAQTLSRISQWKIIQASKLAAKGIPQRDTTPVVSTVDGGFVHPQNLAKSWSRFACANEFEGFTLHQLRHTYATMLVANGVDMKTAATLMGHSSTAMLEKVYAHFVMENAVNAAGLIGDALFGEASAPVVIPFGGVKKTA